MKINRLFEIVYMLLAKKEVTAQILAEHFNVSTRTIYRDIDTLSLAGIPIYTSQGRHGGISLLNEYVLDKMLLSDTEKDHILLSLQTMATTNASDPNLLIKLTHLFKKKENNWLEIDFSNWGMPYEGHQQKFDNIKAAILTKYIITFDYHNTQGNTTYRHVEPFQLYFKSMTWYLKGFCLLKKGDRFFKLTRMSNVVITEHPITHTFDEKAFTIKQKTNVLIKLTLCFSSKIAFRVYDEFEPKNIHRDDKNQLIVTTLLPNEFWLENYLLSFGSDLEIIDPIEMRNKIIKISQDLMKIYS